MDSIERSNIILKTLADEHNTEFIDAYAFFVDESCGPIKEYFSPDGVHLSSKGYKIWTGAIEKVISDYEMRPGHAITPLEL